MESLQSATFLVQWLRTSIYTQDREESVVEAFFTAKKILRQQTFVPGTVVHITKVRILKISLDKYIEIVI